MTTRANFIRGLFGLAFAASVAIRGTAQETTAGKLRKRVPLAIRIPSYSTGELWAMANEGIRAGFDPAGGQSATVRFEVLAETDEPADASKDVRFKIVKYEESTDSFIAERTV